MKYTTCLFSNVLVDNLYKNMQKPTSLWQAIFFCSPITPALGSTNKQLYVITSEHGELAALTRNQRGTYVQMFNLKYLQLLDQHLKIFKEKNSGQGSESSNISSLPNFRVVKHRKATNNKQTAFLGQILISVSRHWVKPHSASSQKRGMPQESWYVFPLDATPGSFQLT